MQNVKREEVLNYLINVHGYSDQDLSDNTFDDLIDLVEGDNCVPDLFDYLGAR